MTVYNKPSLTRFRQQKVAAKTVCFMEQKKKKKKEKKKKKKKKPKFDTFGLEAGFRFPAYRGCRSVNQSLLPESTLSFFSGPSNVSSPAGSFVLKSSR